MKKIVSVALSAILLTSLSASAQTMSPDKSKRPSPPATATATVAGTTITINYSVPSVKGRTIGKDVEPKQDVVWRTGANEATVFEVSGPVKVEGKELAAGKYGLYTIYSGKNCTIIFNKTWDQWGTKYTEADDALRVTVPVKKAPAFAEKLNFSISNDGKTTLLWGDTSVDFSVKPAA